MPKFQIGLDEKHFKALLDLAKQEYRNPRDQAGLLVKEALEKQGLLKQENQGNQNTNSGQDATTK